MYAISVMSAMSAVSFWVCPGGYVCNVCSVCIGMPNRQCIMYWIRGYLGSVCIVCSVGSVCRDMSVVSAMSAVSV